MITVRLTESNFVKWSFQFQSVFEGNDLFGHFDGTDVCPSENSEDCELKTDVQTIKKGADSIGKYLLKIKHARDQLNSVGVTMSDEDIIVVTLNGLSDEYAMIKTVIRAREMAIPLHAQLLAAE
ncbi:hypothetical protein ACLB2K_007211 [Fragaria x ananassa]